MSDINNNYKRFQSYGNVAKPNTVKQDFMEQNYKVEKSLGEKPKLNEKPELKTKDNSFLERSTKLGINSQGHFIKK